jgi:hypothetical protein
LKLQVGANAPKPQKKVVGRKKVVLIRRFSGEAGNCCEVIFGMTERNFAEVGPQKFLPMTDTGTVRGSFPPLYVLEICAPVFRFSAIVFSDQWFLSANAGFVHK